MASPLFKTLIANHPPSRNIYIFKSEECVFIFAVLENIVYISVLPIQIFEHHDKKNKSSFDGETLKHNCTILGIILLSGKFYGLDISGYIFPLCQPTEDEAENISIECDIFEDSPQEKKKWAIEDKTQVFTDASVLSFCTADDKLALLANSESKLTLEIVDVILGKSIKSVTVRTPGLTDGQNICTLTWISTEQIVEEFLKSWFLIDKKTNGFFIITLPEGGILAVFPNSEELHHIYTWPFPVLATHWFFYVQESIPECGLRVVTQGGALLSLSQYGQVTTDYLPIGNLRLPPVINCHCLYISDSINSYRLSFTTSTPLTLNQQCFLLPVKGVICWGEIGKGKVVALTRSGDVYLVDNKMEVTEGMTEMLPDSSMTSTLLKQADRAESLQKTLLEMDAYIAAVSRSLTPFSSLSLAANVISVCGDKCRVYIKVTSKEDIGISAYAGWCLVVSFTNQDRRTTLSQSLDKRLDNKSPFSHVFKVSLVQSNFYQLTVKAKLLYTRIPPFTKYIPVIPIGEIFLNPSHFLQPASEATLPDAIVIPVFEDILKNISEDNGQLDGEKEEQMQYELFVTIPTDEPIFRWLLRNSSAMWRVSQSSKANKDNKCEVWIGGDTVTVEKVPENKVKISGENVTACQAVKRAIFAACPHHPRHVMLNPQLLMIYERQIETLLHTPEPMLEQLYNMRQLIRQNISSKFIP